MNEPLDELYLRWLYSQVSSVRTKTQTRTYWSLFRQLYTKEFVWFIPNDDNRAADGCNLRLEFLEEQELEYGDVDPSWMGLGCSMLELLVGLSRRLSFETGGESRDWFWELLENLDLRQYNDANYDHAHHLEVIDNILNRVIFRTYFANGSGGLFPLRHATRDQREVEIWYQLSAYILEHE